MAEGTKERILRIALELFAQNGYLGTSMNDIAGQLGFTKAALYKHYAGKQEILDKIVERMNRMDYERAEAYEMPETEPDGFAEACLHLGQNRGKVTNSVFRNICKRVLAPHHGHKTQRFSSPTSFMLFSPSFCNQTQPWQ